MIDGLRRGHRFGLIASSDHGHGASYVAVLANSLSRTDIFDGLHARRTCASTTRDVFADLRLGPHLMGSEVEWSGPRPLRVHASGYAELARVDLLRDGEVVHTVRGEPLLAPGELRVDLRVEWGKADKSDALGRPADRVRRAAAGARVRRPGGGGRGPVERRLGARHAQLRRALRRPARRRRGQRLRPARRAGATSSARAGRCGSAWPSWPIGWIGRTWSRRGGRGSVRPGELCCSRPSARCSGWASASSTSPSTTTASAAPAFYYARVIQVDGEMAWSSPIWVFDAR